MKDLKDMCMIEKSVLQDFMKAAGVNDDTYIRGEQKLRQALNQDLSGMVVVPIEPTTEMKAAGASSLEDVVCKYNNTFIRRDYLADDVYKAMLSAAKEKNDD